MFRVHGHISGLRSLFDSTSCGACLKEYHTTQKLKAHLHYSDRCRNVLHSRNVHCAPVAGAGSAEDRARAAVHDRLLPPLQGAGPQFLAPRPRRGQCIDEALHLFLVDTLTETSEDSILEPVLRDYAATHAISWTTWTRTIDFFVDTLSEEDATFLQFDLTLLRQILNKLKNPSA